MMGEEKRRMDNGKEGKGNGGKDSEREWRLGRERGKGKGGETSEREGRLERGERKRKRSRGNERIDKRKKKKGGKGTGNKGKKRRRIEVKGRPGRGGTTVHGLLTRVKTSHSTKQFCVILSNNFKTRLKKLKIVESFCGRQGVDVRKQEKIRKLRSYHLTK